MPKTTVAAPPGSRVSEKVVTTTEKPPVTITETQLPDDDGSQFQPWTTDFWEYIESLKPADWTIHVARVYRYPLNEKKPRELGRYLVRYDVDEPLLNEKQLSSKYGGGQYDVLVHRKRKLIIKAQFDIEGPSRNPDAAALAAAPAAAETGQLASTLNTVLQHLKGIQAPADQAPKLQETIQMITTLAGAIPKGEGVTGLVTALKALDDLRGGGHDRKSELKETIELLVDLGVITKVDAGGAKKSKVEELKEILELADMIRGGSGGGKRDVVTSLIDAAPTIIEKAGTVLDKAVSISQNNARIAEARARIPGTPPAAQPTVTHREIPGAAPAAPERQVAPLETEPAAAAAAQPEAPAGTIALQPPNFDWVKARAVQLFMEGKTGDFVAEFLDTIDSRLGNQLGALSREQLEQFISTDPILGQIAAAPRFKDFVSEILDFFTVEENPPDK